MNATTNAPSPLPATTPSQPGDPGGGDPFRRPSVEVGGWEFLLPSKWR